MRNLLYILILCPILAFSQVPQGVGYQGVATDAAGFELINQSISIRASVLSGSATGTIEWQETHNTSTDTFGLFNLTIGQGTNTGNGSQTSFADITWGANTHFLKIEMDVNGGTNYSHMGTNQMMSVPYALYAENANIDYDSISTLLSNDSTFITTVSGGIGGGCDFNYPDGISGDFVSIDILQGNYTVPAGKNLYILNAMTNSGYQIINLDGNRFIKYDDGYWQYNTETVMAGSGSILSSQYNSGSTAFSTMFGYLADEDYFANCGGNGSSTSTIDSSYVDSLVQFYSIGGGSSHNILFPEGIDGESVTVSLPTGTSYTVPFGKRLYITAKYGGNNTMNINGVDVQTYEHNFYMPIIANSGDVVAPTYGQININGILVNETTGLEAISSILYSGTSYIVPTGKRLYITSKYGGNNAMSINGIDIQTYEAEFHLPIVANAGDIVAPSYSQININGYLIDDNYFANSTGSASSTVDSSYIDSLVQFYTSGNGGCNFNFPDGLFGDAIAWDFINGDYNVPSGKNLYITNVYTLDGYAFRINGMKIMQEEWGTNSSYANNGMLKLPLCAKSGDIVSNSTLAGDKTFYGILVDDIVDPITYEFDDPGTGFETYTVPSGKKLYIMNIWAYGGSNYSSQLTVDGVIVAVEHFNAPSYDQSKALNIPLIINSGSIVSIP